MERGFNSLPVDEQDEYRDNVYQMKIEHSWEANACQHLVSFYPERFSIGFLYDTILRAASVSTS